MLNKMKMLIFADARSKWVKDYFDYVLSDKGYDVYIADFWNSTREIKEEWEKRKVTYIEMENKEIPKSIPFLRRYVYLLKFLLKTRKYGKFDIIHSFFVGVPRSRCIVYSKKRKTNTILTFCGSDLYRANEEKIKNLELFFSKIDHITVMGKSMQKYFKDKYGNKYDDKLSKMFFGLDGFDFIDKSLKKDKIKLRKNFNIEKNLITVGVGYNASPAMQHRKAIEVIATLPDTIKNKLCIILQMTYGINSDFEEYVNGLESLLKENQLKYIIIRPPFLSNEVLADLRVITDVFIHSQITDAFSATIQEFLYSGTTVFNPVWIKYQELIDNDVKFIEYNDFDELSIRLKEYFENPEDYKTDMEYNRKVLTEISSWEKNAPKWLELYKKDN